MLKIWGMRGTPFIAIAPKSTLAWFGHTGEGPLLIGARGVMVTVLGNGHGDTSSNPGRD